MAGMRRKRVYRRVGAAAAVSAVLLLHTACERPAPSPVVARVGKAVLTLRDLQESVPPEYRDQITREQHINYVKQWIDQEILYQGALSMGIAGEETIRKRLEKIKRDLLCAEMLTRNAVPMQDLQISEDAIESYYEKNKESLVRSQDVARYVEIVVDDLKTAWKVREMVAPDNFLSLAASYSKLPVQDPREVPYRPLESLPAAQAEAIRQIRIDGTSQPVKVAEGYALVRVLDRQPAGTIYSLDEARDDIVNILSAKMQKSETERLLSDLRRKTTVTFNFNVIPENTSLSARGSTDGDTSARTGE